MVVLSLITRFEVARSLGDWHEQFASDIAPKDQRVRAMVGSSVKELAEARVRTMNIACEEDLEHRESAKLETPR